ncbi:MAG: UDP-N-acetylmuramate--L-alanine ligase [Phycisphaeraceae bacterium]
MVSASICDVSTSVPTADAAAGSAANLPLELDGQRVHFVGIGGCGMSGLARLARHRGAICSGSDLAESPIVARLRRDGFHVRLEQTARSVPEACDLLVASAAIGPDHPERREAERRAIPVLKYAQMLGRLMIGRTGVAVAGTHGKSTTTSLLSHLLIQGGCEPSFLVGATCQQIGGGSGTGASDILVAEACEFDRSFHNFHPTHALILNVEADHLDIYRDLDDIVGAFAEFARRVPEHGSLLIQHELPTREAITAGLACPVETLGYAADADWRIEQLPADRTPGSTGPITRLYREGELAAEWASPMPGEHMAYNAAAAAVTARRLGASWDDIARALGGFRGLDRRMQVLGTHELTPDSGPVTLIDDYGHHPTEIDATLQALRRHYQPTRLICVFQPHQHTRTKMLLKEFGASFDAADRVIVPGIYHVRESEAQRRAVTADQLVEQIRANDVQAERIEPFAAVVEHLCQATRPGDLVVTMGAGDVWKISHALVER